MHVIECRVHWDSRARQSAGRAEDADITGFVVVKRRRKG